MSRKKAYEHELKARLLEFEAEIERFRAKAENAEEDAKARYHAEIQELEQRREKMQAKFNEFREASESAWDDLKSGIEAAWEVGFRSILEINHCWKADQKRFPALMSAFGC